MQKHDKGFSLVGVMVAIGLTGVVSLGIMKINEMGNKGVKQVNSRTEIGQIQTELLSILSDRSACTYTMLASGGADLTSLIGHQSRQLNSIKTKNNGDFIPRFPAKRGGVFINKVTVRDWDEVEKVAKTEVAYNYQLGPEQSVSRNLFFNLSFEMDPDNPNLMTSCIARAGQAVTDAKLLCESVVGLDSEGNSYWENGMCNFPKASCEQVGRVWNPTEGICEMQEVEQLSARALSCQNQNGYLVKLKYKPNTQSTIPTHGAYNITTQIEKCSDEDMNLEMSPCFCKTEFHHFSKSRFPNHMYKYGGPSTGFDNLKMHMTLKTQKFNAVSPVYTIPNLLSGRTGKRFMRIHFRTTIENHSKTKKHYISGIGCYRVNGPHNKDHHYAPLITSTDGNSLFATGGGTPRYIPDDFVNMPGKEVNSYSILPSIYSKTSNGTDIAAYGGEWENGELKDYERERRETTIEATEFGYFEPGDKCVLLLYNANNEHEIGIEKWKSSVTVTQYTNEAQFLHGAVPHYNYAMVSTGGGIKGISLSEEAVQIQLPIAGEETQPSVKTGIKTSGTILEKSK